MFNKKYAACFILLLFNTAVQAELFVVKEVGGKVVPLAASDWDNYKGNDGIFGILQKYQWPMNTVSDLTKEEIRELFAEKPYAERDFIEKKIQEKFTDGHYKVIFIPTTLYELFAILMVHEKPFREWNNIRSKIFDKNIFKTMHTFFQEKHKMRLNKNVIMNELLTWGYLVHGYGAKINGFHEFSKDSIDDEIRTLIKNETKISSQEIRKKIYSLYTKTINHIESMQVHFLFNWYIGDQILNAYDKKDFNDIAANVIKKINLKGASPKFSKKKDTYCNAQLYELSQKNRSNFLLSSIAQNELTEKSKLNQNGIVAQTISLEIEAQKKNAALIFRGTSMRAISLPTKQNPTLKKLSTKKKHVIASSLWISKTNTSFEAIAQSYKKNDFTPYSISYGITLFAGLFFDSGLNEGAMAYGYFGGKNYGYALRINKLRYKLSLGKPTSTTFKEADLFFIPPVSTLIGLFAEGEFFHARGKACTSKDPTKNTDIIEGIVCDDYCDHSGLFLIQRDPLEYAAKFSQFIADHGIILKLGTSDKLSIIERNGLVKAAQKESAQYFGAIPKLKRFTDKIKGRHFNYLRQRMKARARIREQIKEQISEIKK